MDYTPLPTNNDEDEPVVSADGHNEQAVLSRRQLWGLYTSHTLSTWNARGYEFAAVGPPPPAIVAM